MVNSIRKAVESLYTGKCTVYEYKEVTDTETFITDFEETEVLKDISCRLSYKSSTQSNESGAASALNQEIKLFISPEIKIKEGSKIEVTQNGVTESYKNSGVPAVYSGHQEIILELFKEWA